MDDNRSSTSSSATNQGDLMEVDGQHRNQPKSSPMMGSRFGHLDGGLLGGGSDPTGQRNIGDVREQEKPNTTPEQQKQFAQQLCEQEKQLEQQLHGQQLREQQFREQQQQLCEQEQQLLEQERQLLEQQLCEQQLCEQQQQLREQQQQLREQQLREQQLREQQLHEQQLREQQQQNWRPPPICNPSFIPEVPVNPEPPRPQQFKIHVKNVDGKRHNFTVEGTTLVQAFRKMIQQQLGIPPEQQVLNFAGKNLQDGKTLDFYDITEDSTVNVTGRLRGG